MMSWKSSYREEAYFRTTRTYVGLWKLCSPTGTG